MNLFSTLFRLSAIPLLLVIIFQLSCQKDKVDPPEPLVPIACFEVNRRMLKVGESIKFINCSSHFSESDWSFGDGRSSDSPEPVHTFDSAGIYQVLLTVTQGSLQSAVTRKLVAGKTARLQISTRFSRWQYPSDYTGIELGGVLEREQSLEIYGYDGPRKSTLNDTLKTTDFTFNLLDDLSTFRLKIYIYGVTSFTTDKLDSLMIGNIDAIEGKKDSVGVLYSKIARMNYTVEPIRFQ